MTYPELTAATWPLALPTDLSRGDMEQIRSRVDQLAAEAQYGWGHTIDFGAFRKEGLLGEDYLKIAGGLDEWGWWPSRLDGLQIADVGCFTGGLSLLMAHRGASIVYAIDEIPQHLAQASFLADTFRLSAVRPILRSIYSLGEDIPKGSLDVVLLSGVLYHLSDMLVGLYAVRELLKPDGLLLMQSQGVDDFDHSYANFGRFFAGTWWQPTGLCISDMCSFMGFKNCEVKFYASSFCLARATRSEDEILYRRGLNWPFSQLRDKTPRSLDPKIMSPAPISSSR